MSSIRVICDANFTKASVIDKSVEKLLKMFKKRFDSKSRPLDDDSNVSCIYRYGNLSHDEVRIMKKLLNSKGDLIHLKRIESCESPADTHSDDSVECSSVECNSVECKPKGKAKDKPRGKRVKKDSGGSKKGRGKAKGEPSRSTSSRASSLSSHCTPPPSVDGCATPCDSETSDISEDSDGPDCTKSALIDEARVLCRRLQSVVDSLEKV